MPNSFTYYAAADRTPEGHIRVLKFVLDTSEGVEVRSLEFVIEVEYVDQIAFYDEFDDVHYVTQGHDNTLIETGALSLAEALEATLLPCTEEA